MAIGNSNTIAENGYVGVAELVDATDLDDLSASSEMLSVELPKFGERFQHLLMPIPSQAGIIRKV